MPNIYKERFPDPSDYFNSPEFKQEQKEKEEEYKKIIEREWSKEDQIEYERWMRGK